jgi:hypothetical protein
LYPATLNGSVWGKIQSEIAGKDGWHAFGLAIMDSFHSVTLLVNVRPGGPFLYFVDQTNRSDIGSDTGVDNTYRLGTTIPGTQQFAADKLDAYLEFYAHKNYPGYVQRLINKNEKAGKTVTEKDLYRMQPDSQMDLWKMSKTKQKQK